MKFNVLSYLCNYIGVPVSPTFPLSSQPLTHIAHVLLFFLVVSNITSSSLPRLEHSYGFPPHFLPICSNATSLELNQPLFKRLVLWPWPVCLSWLEHRPMDQKVVGSIPGGGT